MAEPIYVEITDRKHAAGLNRWIGKAEAYEALKAKAKDFDRLPGFGLAMAILEAEVAHDRSMNVAENLRCLARAGHDVGRSKQVELELGPNGLQRLKVIMMDLADLGREGDG